MLCCVVIFCVVIFGIYFSDQSTFLERALYSCNQKNFLVKYKKLITWYWF